MHKWAVRRLIRRNARSLERGDPAPLLAGYARDAVLVFPGRSSWAGEYRGRASIESFLVRFIDAGLVGDVLEILVNGPPWRTTVSVLFEDRATDEKGDIVYADRVILFCRVAWGKVIYQEDFLDTQRVEAFDQHLGRHSSPTIPPARTGASPPAFGVSDQP
jgi:ketosteroid isomerase-like protein